MGQKVNPKGLRLGIIKYWDSKWYAEKDYALWLHEDISIRTFLVEHLKAAGIEKIEIERATNKLKINIFTARPGIIIGKKGAGIEYLKKEVQALSLNEVFINIFEVRKVELSAQLVAEGVATQIERRAAYRRVLKKAVASSMKFGAEGVKICLAGRLGGAEIARREWYKEGRIPLHTLRADIDYGQAEALTTYGIIGIKVWIFKGEIFST